MLNNIKLKLENYLSIMVYYFIAWLTHLVIVSIVSFFHFRLDHRLIVVENWLFDFAWTIGLLSKLFSFIIYFKYFSDVKNLNAEIFDSSRWSGFNPAVVVYSLMNVIVLSVVSQLKFFDNVLFSYEGTLLNYITVFLFYFIDIFVFSLLKKNDNYKKWDIVYSAIIVFIFNIALYPYLGVSSLKLFSVILLFFTYFYNFNTSYLNTSLFLLIVLCPLFAIFGADPFWGNKYSAFLSNSDSTLYYIILAIVMLFYFTFFKRRTL